jgi:bacillithiol biosynthesis cysteine-adding enzyme BshC
VQTLLAWSEPAEWLAAAYRPGITLAQAFRSFYARLFGHHGLLILDPSGREAHREGAPVLRAAIERADELHQALLLRNRELEAAGYHAQVAVGERSSLLFLIDSATGARAALRRTAGSADQPDGSWQAGRLTLTTAELLAILDSEPERISPSALLRPVFQDFVLPNSAYVGGPAEIAYFAQSAVLFEKILGRITPVLPRFSATVIDAPTAALLARYDLTPERVIGTDPDTLTQSLAARSMSIETKQTLAAAGNALDRELTVLTEHLAAMDANLGRSAMISASKMRYQMNRLRRMAANFQLQREGSIARDAAAISMVIFPNRAPQERLMGAATLFSLAGVEFVDRLVREAADPNPGHRLLWL